jgi:myo-inositol-1(or 4)-monophosphatase
MPRKPGYPSQGMTRRLRQTALAAAGEAARKAGDLMRRHLHSVKEIDSATPHDLKLALDDQCQREITHLLATTFPDIPVLGEEGVDVRAGKADHRWVVDPIDGTVNFAHGIPHAAVSIALQERVGEAYTTTMGLVHDPFMEETWTALAGEPARRNGRRIQVSTRPALRDAVISLGFAKSTTSLNRMLPVFHALVPRVRKIRLMGSAALAMVYVADGRFDAYIESGIRLWDIAAGALIVESAGGDVKMPPLKGRYRHQLQTSSAVVANELDRIVRRAIRPTTP